MARRDGTCSGVTLRLVRTEQILRPRTSTPALRSPRGPFMRIRKLDITGFKSFVDRTVIEFDEDVIGVVGPNGCGKSNIVDAIRWAMGEQSAKHLRGRAMADVIFNGSDTRGPHGFAEVTLVFDN